MSQVSAAAPRRMAFGEPNAATAFALAVVVPTCALIATYLISSGRDLPRELILWTLLVAVVELLPAPAWGGVSVSLGFPILTAVAITYDPGAAALVALVGSFDPREFRHEVTLLRALFNRSQVALAVLAASGVFHSLSSVHEPLTKILPATLVATVIDYSISIGAVCIAVGLMSRVPIRTVLRNLSKGNEFLVSYVGLGLIGGVLAKLYSLPQVGIWSVITVLAPLLFARAMFLRSHALEDAHKELQEREQVLRQLSNAMAEERADERLQIAGYLHDDLAQVLFRLSLQVDVARKLLDRKDLDDLASQLEKIRSSKQETSERIRALIRDLHRSPLGAKGLAEAFESFTDEVGRDSGVTFHHDIEDISMPAPIALLLYHVGREGVMNALKHANASNVWIRVSQDAEDIVLQLRDDGAGFDTSAPGPEGHFGMAMMRERAQVGGGTLEVASAPGEGTIITVRFPIALLQQEATEAASAATSANVSGVIASAQPERPAPPAPEATTPERPDAEPARPELVDRDRGAQASSG